MPAQLRPIRASDFDEALKEVPPSLASESFVLDELKQWNSKYGEGSDRRYQNPALTYFT